MTETMEMYWQDQESANDVQPTEDHAHLNVQVIFVFIILLLVIIIINTIITIIVRQLSTSCSTHPPGDHLQEQHLQRQPHTRDLCHCRWLFLSQSPPIVINIIFGWCAINASRACSRDVKINDFIH